MPDELEERLRSHARSLDGLLSLIPAKLYYGEDVSDQWKRKKQTPEQKRAAKMAKLDPDNWRSAKDVVDERAAAAKRKRDDLDDDTSLPDGMDIEIERPKAQQEQVHKSKKQKIVDQVKASAPTTSSDEYTSSLDAKKQRKAEKKAAKQQAKQKQKEKKQKQKDRKTASLAVPLEAEEEWSDVSADEDTIDKAVTVNQDQPGLLNMLVEDDHASTASSSTGVIDIMSPPAESGSSSISSVQPDQTASSHKIAVAGKTKVPKVLADHQHKSSPKSSSALPSMPTQSAIEKLNDTDKAAARDRLTAAISSFRTQRKADTHPRNRQDLLNARRIKEETRRAAKKEQRRNEREEAARLADEEIERRFSPGGSGSLLGSPRSPTMQNYNEDSNNFSFGRIAFEDGSEIDPSTSNSLSDRQRKKGPQDMSTALQAAKNKQSRLAGLDETKRKQIEEKDMWLNAKKRAHGERVKDDTSLLKKALKRQEAQKKKSEKEWTDRKDGIQKAQEAKQKKRTDNLAKRKEERKHGKKAGSKGHKVKRPGFEGSFRGRSGSMKKK